jgi:hypothetical protein
MQKTNIKERKIESYEIATKNSIEEAAEYAGISVGQGEEILRFYFNRIYNLLCDDRMPTIKLPFIGKFWPTIGGIGRVIRRSFTQFKKGRIPRFLLINRIRRYWPIKQRIQRFYFRKYKMIRDFLNKGETDVVLENAWQYWRNIPMDFQKEHNKETDRYKKEYYHGRAQGRFDRFEKR